MGETNATKKKAMAELSGQSDRLLRDAWIEKLSKLRLLVVVGAGGVGKTSMASSIAVALARRGLSVGLLSIDPSKRLAQALGLDFSGQMKRVKLSPSLPGDGKLSASILNEKVIFDDLVLSSSKTQKNADKILDHPLYKFASTKFGGIGEYMALARVAQLLGDPSFDIVLLDTPPDAHALDFLDRPKKIKSLLDGRIIKLLLLPITLGSKLGLGRLTSAGSKLFGGLSKVTGVAALTILAEFIVMMKDVIIALASSAESLSRNLKTKQTGFAIVTTTRYSARGVGLAFTEELEKRGLSLTSIILNRLQMVGTDKVDPKNLDPDFSASWTHYLEYLGKQETESLKTENQFRAELRKKGKQEEVLFLKVGEDDPFFYSPAGAGLS